MGPWVWALARYALILVTRKCVLVLMQYLFLYDSNVLRLKIRLAAQKSISAKGLAFWVPPALPQARYSTSCLFLLPLLLVFSPASSRLSSSSTR